MENYEKFTKNIQTLKELEWLVQTYPSYLEELKFDKEQTRLLLIKNCLKSLKVKKIVKNPRKNWVEKPFNGQCIQCGKEMLEKRHPRAKTCSPECSNQLQLHNQMEWTKIAKQKVSQLLCES